MKYGQTLFWERHRSAAWLHIISCYNRSAVGSMTKPAWQYE